MESANQIQNDLPARLIAVLRRLGEMAAAHGEELYLVGGAVRDLILRRPFREADLTLVGNVDRLAKEAEAAGLAKRTATSQFLTVKLKVDGHDVDLVTARKESYPEPGSLPIVEPDGLEADMRRRDFSINALAASLHPERFGHVVDLLGGLPDLEAGLLRGLHPGTFRDDATRILRLARYAARLGCRLERETEGWLRRDAHYLKTISPDRLRHEMERVFQEERPDIALGLLADWSAFKHLGPGLKWSKELSEAFRKAQADVPPDVPPLTVQWALLAWPLGRDSGEALVRAFNLPVAEVRAIRDLFRWRRPFGNGGVFRDTLAEASPRGVVERLEGYDLASLTALSLIEDEGRVGERLRRYLDEWRHVRPALSGNDLLALGVPQGPQMGAYLKRLRLARLDGEVTTADDERALVRRWLGEAS